MTSTPALRRYSWAATLAAALASTALSGLAGCASLSDTLGGATATAKDDKSAQLLRLADKTRDGGDFAAAATLYQRAHDVAPEDAAPLIGLAQTAALSGEVEQAATAYRKAVALDPASLAGHRGYAQVLITLNRPKLAVQHFRRAIGLAPDDYKLHNGLAIALDLAGQHEEAQQSYVDAMERAPDNLSLRNNLGLSLALGGNHGEAARTLRDAAAIPGDARLIRQNLALVLALDGKPEEAAGILARDLPDAQAEQNLAYFKALRGLAGSEIAAEIMGLTTRRGTAAGATNGAGAVRVLPATGADDPAADGAFIVDRAASRMGDRSPAVEVAPETAPPPRIVAGPTQL